MYKTIDKVHNFTSWKLTGESNEPCILVRELTMQRYMQLSTYDGLVYIFRNFGLGKET